MFFKEHLFRVITVQSLVSVLQLLNKLWDVGFIAVGIDLKKLNEQKCANRRYYYFISEQFGELIGGKAKLLCCFYV